MTPAYKPHSVRLKNRLGKEDAALIDAPNAYDDVASPEGSQESL